MKLKLLLKENDTNRILIWEKNGNTQDDLEVVKLKVPIRGGNSDSQLNIEADVNANGSLESASHRATLFSRLIDEHNVISG